MRLRPIKAAEAQSLAQRLGRKLKKRSSPHPMWESEEFPHLPPLSIPDHGGGRDLSPGVRKGVLDQLEEDIIEWDKQTSQNGTGH